MIIIREETIPFESKRNNKCPYWYIFKHGIGPGTVPDDVKIGKVKDIDNYYSIVWIDRPLSTDELKYYDIYPETMNMSILKNKLGYTQAEIDNLLDEKPIRPVRNNNIISAFDENLKKEYVYDDDEELDDGDIVYEARAYYGKNFSGLAHSEDFANTYELNEWIWGMCQDGYFVEVRDLEDGSWTRYAWLDDDGTGTFEPMSVDDLIIWTNA